MYVPGTSGPAKSRLEDAWICGERVGSSDSKKLALVVTCVAVSQARAHGTGPGGMRLAHGELVKGKATPAKLQTES